MDLPFDPFFNLHPDCLKEDADLWAQIIADYTCLIIRSDIEAASQAKLKMLKYFIADT
jgi:hypothetical protein